jgi:sulfate/thiosulfate-binding protein
MKSLFLRQAARFSCGLALLLAPAFLHAGEFSLLNVSYDPTRELYVAYNKAFAAHWLKETGDTVTINQSHGGSGAQALSVINGLEADVVTLGIPSDINAISQKTGLIAPDWSSQFKNDSVPYTSTIVFLVRKGNPKGIKGWADLVKDGVGVITPNPKSSSGGRWAYLAAWAWALKQPGASEASARDYVAKLYKNVPVLDSGARGSTTTFTQRGIGDVLLAWENEAHLALQQLGPEQVEIVVPSESILAEAPVAVVDKVAEKHGSTKLAKAYLQYLYSPEAQAIAAENFYRPTDKAVAAKYAANFPKIKLFHFKKIFGSWDDAQKKHFADGGIFDQIYTSH